MKKVLPLMLIAVLVSIPLAFNDAHAGVFGSISGTVFDDTNGNGVQDGGELGVQNVSVCVGFPEFFDDVLGFDNFFLPLAHAGEGGGIFTCDNNSLTDLNGDYSLDNLLIGSHDVFINLPNGFFPTSPLVQSVSIGSVGVDFGIKMPEFPNSDINISPLGNFQINGLPVVHWNNDLVITKDVGPLSSFDHCDADIPDEITFEFGPFSETGGMFVQTQTSPSAGETWEWSVPAVNPGHGIANLRFVVVCPNGPDEIQEGGQVFIDPSGVVIDACTMLPIQGATARLFRQDQFGDFELADNFFPHPAIPQNDFQLTDASGAYGWMVVPGLYRVDISAPGYDPQQSNILTIPPPRTDVDFALTPTGQTCGAQIGGEIIPLDSVSLVLANAAVTSWMIPVVISAIGIGIVIIRRK